MHSSRGDRLRPFRAESCCWGMDEATNGDATRRGHLPLEFACRQPITHMRADPNGQSGDRQ